MSMLGNPDANELWSKHLRHKFFARPFPYHWDSVMSLEIPRGLSLEQINTSLTRISGEKLDFELKYWQRDGTAQLLSGKDVLLLAETSGGKSLLFWLYAYARPNETVIVISPLKMLEKNMVDRLERGGIRATGLNADTIAAAEREGRDIWKECTDGHYQVILCSPEQLASAEMAKLLDNNQFQSRVGLVVVDEAHLIPVWGGKIPGQREFRGAFLTIGSIRSRLRTRTVFLALSATLMPGIPLKTVEDTLGLRGDRYHPIKLDCDRKNLHLVLRRINHSVSTGTFADLDWLLAKTFSAPNYDPLTIPKTVIYVDNIAQGHQLATYLQKLLPTSFRPHSRQLIHHLHASTCAQCKDEILNDFSDTNGVPRLRIVVATEAFGCGIDIPDIEQVVNLGTPRTLDSALQRVGRAGRGLQLGKGIIYVNQQTWDAIKKSISNQSRTGEGDSKVCRYFRMVLVAHLKRQCISKRIKAFYSHNETELESEPESNEMPEADDRCMQCSGCIDDTPPEPNNTQSNETQAPKGQKRKVQRAGLIPKSGNRGPGQLTKEMSTRYRQQLHEIICEVWLSVSATEATQFEGPASFVSAEMTVLLFRYIRDIETVDRVRTLLGNNWRFWDSHGAQLAKAILELRRSIINELVAEKQRKDSRKGQQEGSGRFEQKDTQSGSELASEGGDESEAQEAYEDELEYELERAYKCVHKSSVSGESNDPSQATISKPRLTIRLPAGAFKRCAMNDADEVTESG